MRKCLSIISIVLMLAFCLCGCKKTGKYNSSVIESDNVSSELTVVEKDGYFSSSTESKNTTSNETSSKENSSINSNNSDSASKDNSSKVSSKLQTVASKPATSSSAPTTPNSSTTEKKDWLDESLLTYTQADVGKVIGYSSAFNQDITVLYVEEGTNVSGLRFIDIQYSPTGYKTVVECKFCHKFPCPDGGSKNCPEYDRLKDGTVTCQQCGKPVGDGYNGTCHGLINWDDPTKPFISCNYYD